MTPTDQDNQFRAPPTRESVATLIAASDTSWDIPAAPLRLSDHLRWRPDLEDPSSGRVLHIQLTGELPSYIVERLRLVAQEGRRVHVALPLGALWNLEAVISLSEVDAQVHMLDGDYKPHDPTPLLTALADHEIRLPVDTRRTVGEIGWERCKSASTANEKGRRLESLLVFLLAQSRELKVMDTRLRTETEEIDIVARARVVGLARCWVLPTSPFVLLEAKNWSDPVGKPAVSDLLTKLRGYRRTAKVGVLVGAQGFTGDARKHELRFASEEGTIAFVDAKELEAWIAADDLDEYFEDLVKRAMLR